MIVSERLYTPQKYLELITDKCYIIKGTNDVETIEVILEDLGYCLWSHALTEIGYVLEEELDVVLVDCMVYNEKTEEYEHVYRWFEIDFDPKDIEELEKRIWEKK